LDFPQTKEHLMKRSLSWMIILGAWHSLFAYEPYNPNNRPSAQFSDPTHFTLSNDEETPPKMGTDRAFESGGASGSGAGGIGAAAAGVGPGGHGGGEPH
jgi:hypothetical protein